MKHCLLSTDCSYELQPLMSLSCVHSVQKSLHSSLTVQENAESIRSALALSRSTFCFLNAE